MHTRPHQIQSPKTPKKKQLVSFATMSVSSWLVLGELLQSDWERSVLTQSKTRHIHQWLDIVTSYIGFSHDFTSNFRSVFIHERRWGPDDSIRCWTFDRAGRVIIAPRAALPDNYRIIPLVLGCVFLCRIFSWPAEFCSRSIDCIKLLAVLMWWKCI